MLNALHWGAIASSSLILGGLIASWFTLGRRILGIIMAFGARALICEYCAGIFYTIENSLPISVATPGMS